MRQACARSSINSSRPAQGTTRYWPWETWRWSGAHAEARAWWEKLIEAAPHSVPLDMFERTIASEDVSAEQKQTLQHWYEPDSAAPPLAYLLRRDEPLDDEARVALVDLWNQRGLAPGRLAYPHTSLDVADVRVRLVLASICEGSLARARGELTAFEAMHPDAKGRLGGLEVNYAAALADLLAKAPAWPQPRVEDDWSTFAGTVARSKIAPAAFQPDVPLWPKPAALPKPPVTESSYPSPRVAETKNDLLSYHPIVVDNLVLVNTQNEIRAYDIGTGKPAWGDDPVIYRPADPVPEPHARHAEYAGSRPLHHDRARRASLCPDGRFTYHAARGQLDLSSTELFGVPRFAQRGSARVACGAFAGQMGV